MTRATQKDRDALRLFQAAIKAVRDGVTKANLGYPPSEWQYAETVLIAGKSIGLTRARLNRLILLGWIDQKHDGAGSGPSVREAHVGLTDRQVG